MELDVIATVLGPDPVTAPFSGETAAVVHISACRGDETLGEIVLGDLLRLRFDGGEIELVARRATFFFLTQFDAPRPPIAVPELVPWLQRGATGFRERLVRAGDRMRVRGPVERYSSLDAARFVASSVIRLDETLSFP